MSIYRDIYTGAPPIEGGLAIKNFANLQTLYAATGTLVSGDICRIAWTGDAHVADAEIITMWDGSAFTPNPQTQVEMPGWIYGTEWTLRGDATSRVLAYNDGRPSVRVNSGDVGGAYSYAVMTGAGMGLPITQFRMKFRGENLNLTSAFHRSLCGVATQTFVHNTAGETCLLLGRISSASSTMWSYTSTGTFAEAALFARTITADDNWVVTGEIADGPTLSEGSLAGSATVRGIANIEGEPALTTATGLVLASQGHGGNMFGDRLDLAPTMFHLLGGGASGSNGYSLELLSVELRAGINQDGGEY